MLRLFTVIISKLIRTISPEDFLFQEEERKNILRKLKFFTGSGRDKLHLLLDFDRTLTKSKNELGENVTTWEILRVHLPQEAQKEYQQFYKKYRRLETENKMAVSDAIIWWERILNLFQENELKWLDIAKDVEERIPIRPCAKELFEICEKKNIPTIIISAGIKDIIELWCQRFEISPTIILFTNLTFSSEGYMNGWDKDSLIHVLNKKEKGHKEVEKIKLKRPNTILVGDSLDDASMIEGGENVLRIAVYEPRKDDKIKKVKEFTERFNLVIKDGTFRPVREILSLF